MRNRSAQLKFLCQAQVQFIKYFVKQRHSATQRLLAMRTLDLIARKKRDLGTDSWYRNLSRRGKQSRGGDCTSSGQGQYTQRTSQTCDAVLWFQYMCRLMMVTAYVYHLTKLFSFRNILVWLQVRPMKCLCEYTFCITIHWVCSALQVGLLFIATYKFKNWFIPWKNIFVQWPRHFVHPGTCNAWAYWVHARRRRKILKVLNAENSVEAISQ